MKNARPKTRRSGEIAGCTPRESPFGCLLVPARVRGVFLRGHNGPDWLMRHNCITLFKLSSQSKTTWLQSQALWPKRHNGLSVACLAQKTPPTGVDSVQGLVPL